MKLDSVKNRVIFGINEPIDLRNCQNIIILQCDISNIPAINGVYLYRCKNILIVNCTFTNMLAGVYADSCFESIVVDKNRFRNMSRIADGGGQAVQFNKVNGYGCMIMNNNILNYVGSNPEDAINIYQSNGTKDSPILILNNEIRGGGLSPSGGGIMLGDQGGSYQTAMYNKLVNPGQYGIGITGGDYNSLINNTVYAGKGAVNNVGLQVYPITPITNWSVVDNRINYTNKAGIRNDAWFHSSINNGKCVGIISDDSLTETLVNW